MGSLFKRKPRQEKMVVLGPGASWNPPGDGPDPEQLKGMLFGSLASGRREETVALCRQHADAIWSAWPGWVFGLIALQAQPDQAQAHAASLRGIAEIFAELGDGRFMNAFGD
ncbi:MAG: hypothetical protein HY319_26305 [Armatimonadetes bacterium]|nr:hypothetical protein [Armatimonadota bacterium]